MPYDTESVDEFKKRARFVILFSAGVFLFLFVLWVARVILLLLLAAVLCALLLTTATDWLRARVKLSRCVALTLIVVGGAGLLGLGVWLRGPEVAEQFSKLQIDLPIAAHKLLAQLHATDWGRWLLSRFSNDGQKLSAFAYAMSRIGGIVVGGVTIIAGLVIVGMAGLYFAAEPGAYLKGLRLATPRRYQNELERCLTGASKQLRWWLLAKLVSMFAVGLLIATGLWILRIPLAGTLGIIAACLTFIPNAGPILSAVPAGLLAFAVSPTKGMLTILLFCAVHFIEGNFVTPLAERKIVKLPPGLTLAVQLFLASVTGVLGVALAAPLTAAVSGMVSTLMPPANANDAEKMPKTTECLGPQI